MVARKLYSSAARMKEEIRRLQEVNGELKFHITRLQGKERDAPMLSQEIRRNTILICRLAKEVREIEAGTE